LGVYDPNGNIRGSLVFDEREAIEYATEQFEAYEKRAERVRLGQKSL
jgi:predicted transcriptional regulator